MLGLLSAAVCATRFALCDLCLAAAHLPISLPALQEHHFLSKPSQLLIPLCPQMLTEALHAGGSAAQAPRSSVPDAGLAPRLQCYAHSQQALAKLRAAATQLLPPEVQASVRCASQLLRRAAYVLQLGMLCAARC